MCPPGPRHVQALCNALVVHLPPCIDRRVYPQIIHLPVLTADWHIVMLYNNILCYQKGRRVIQSMPEAPPEVHRELGPLSQLSRGIKASAHLKVHNIIHI